MLFRLVERNRFSASVDIDDLDEADVIPGAPCLLRVTG